MNSKPKTSNISLTLNEKRILQIIFELQHDWQTLDQRLFNVPQKEFEALLSLAFKLSSAKNLHPDKEGMGGVHKGDVWHKRQGKMLLFEDKEKLQAYPYGSVEA